jgi:hypothetical protein
MPKDAGGTGASEVQDGDRLIGIEAFYGAGG